MMSDNFSLQGPKSDSFGSFGSTYDWVVETN